MTNKYSLIPHDVSTEQPRDTQLRMSERGVREPSSPPAGEDVRSNIYSAPAHPSHPLVAELNKRWRVIDDPLQWILQKRKGHPRKKNSGWRGHSFCRTRNGLTRCIRELCGEVDATAFAKIAALPAWHPDKGRGE